MAMNDTWQARAAKIAAERLALASASRKRRIAARQRQLERAAKTHKRRCS